MQKGKGKEHPKRKEKKTSVSFYINTSWPTKCVPRERDEILNGSLIRYANE